LRVALVVFPAAVLCLARAGEPVTKPSEVRSLLSPQEVRKH
jgi:hypothetical protein